MLIKIVFVCLALVGAQASANWVNVIGNERAMCSDQFVKAKPHLTTRVREAIPSVLEMDCGPAFKGSAVLVDTPSQRVVVTARHVISTYAYKNDKLQMTEVGDPFACRFRVQGSRQWTRADRFVRYRAGHSIHELNMNAHNDWIVLALQDTPIGARAAPIANPREFAIGSEILLKGAIGWNGRSTVTCSWATTCTLHAARRDPPLATYTWTDCSNVSGMSGGPAFIESTDGQLKVAGILSGSAIERRNGSPYQKDVMSTSLIAIDNDLLRAVLDVERILGSAPEL